MRKMILMGRVASGKTTLTQALRSETIHYHKTQYINNYDVVVDTPGEYAEQRTLAHALALYAYECDVVGFLIAANEPYSLFEPGCAACANRPVIGIITKVNAPDANLVATENWLRIAGVKDIFHVDSVTGEGLAEIFEYLAEEGDQLPWLAQKRQKEQKNRAKQPQNNKKPKSSTQKPQKTAKK